MKSFIVLFSTTNSFICTQLTNSSNVPSTFSKTKPLCPTPCSFMVLLHEHRWFQIMASTVYINSLKLKCAISIQLSTNGIAKIVISLFLNPPTSSIVQKKRLFRKVGTKQGSETHRPIMFTNKPTNGLQLSLKHFNIEQNKHTQKNKK